MPHHDQGQQSQPLEDGDHQAVRIAEQDGGALDAQFQVVFPVAHGVFGVVGHGPHQVGHVQQPGDFRHGPGFGGKGHGNGPAEGGAKKQLRHKGEALGKGVQHRQPQPAEGQPERQFIEKQHQHKGQQPQPAKQRQGFLGADSTGGQRTAFGAFHIAVEIPVGKIVNHAASGTHDDHPENEDHHGLQAGRTVPGNPHRPQGRPQQQQGADGAVQPHQLNVGPERRVALFNEGKHGTSGCQGRG